MSVYRIHIYMHLNTYVHSVCIHDVCARTHIHIHLTCSFLLLGEALIGSTMLSFTELPQSLTLPLCLWSAPS